MNEPLRRALLRARLREDDVAARLGVDPKTVRRWLNGRVPYPHNRAAIAELVGADEAELWPDAGGLLAARTFGPRNWGRFTRTGGLFRGRPGYGCSDQPSARSPSWLTARCSWPRTPESSGFSSIRARAGVSVRIALGDPDGPNVAERGEEGIGDAMPAKIRNALTLYRPLGTAQNIEIRLHRTVLYNSIYRADDQLLVNQHAYGIPAAQAPVFCLSDDR